MFNNRSTLDSVRQFFLSRPNYSESKTTLVYENEDTDFGFTIDFHDENPDPTELKSVVGPHIVVYVNYLRPEPYVQEIACELQAFASKFSFHFFDETSDETTTFSLERFIRNWKDANRSGLRGKFGEFNLSSADDAVVENVWSWNYNRRKSEEKFDQEFYVAKVMWNGKQGSGGPARTICTWPDLIPIILPEYVDQIVLIRTESKTTKLGNIFRKKPEILTFGQIVNVSQLRKTGAFETFKLGGLDCIKLTDKSNANLNDLFRSVVTPMETILKSASLVAPEQVIERSFAE
jgi:hypothetical protein